MATQSLIHSSPVSKAQRLILDHYFAQGLRTIDYPSGTVVIFPDGSEIRFTEHLERYAAAFKALEHQSEARQPRRFLTCRSCGKGVLLAPEGSTPDTSYLCRNCTPRPQSNTTFETFRDDAATRALMARFEADRNSGLDDLD